MIPDYLQWLRYVQVVVGKNGKGLDLRATDRDGLRIVGTIEKTIRHQPNTCDLTIYNQHPDDERLELREFDDVIVSAGYRTRAPAPGQDHDDPSLFIAHMIFRGNLKHSVAYWDTADRKVDIQAADGDKDYRLAIVNASIEAGKSDEHEVREALRAMSSTSKGFIDVKKSKRLRGKVILAPAREVLHKAAANNDAHWSIQDGALQIVKSTGVLPNEAIVVNYETGLVGAPELSDKGVKVPMLLNPFVEINGRLWLNNNDVKIQQTHDPTGKKSKTQLLSRLAEDGVYKVYAIRHEFDTMGEARTYADCVAVGDPIPSEGAVKKQPVRL